MSGLKNKDSLHPEEEWLAQLRELYEKDKTVQHKKEQKAKEVKSGEDLLRRTRAYQLMRQVQKTFLNGGGLLDASEGVGQYDRAITLVWQGSISQARRPNPKDPSDYFYIQVGLRGEHLWVNDQRTPAKTTAELRQHILRACQNPACFKRDE
jgi:hypothetical protein